MRPSTADLVKVALKHAAAEGVGDMAATLETLEANPVYELFPVGRRMTGADRARRYYEHFFAKIQPRIAGYEMVAEWIGDIGVCQEYSLRYQCESGVIRTFRVLGILTFGQTKLSGERLYADEEFLKILFQPVWDEMEEV